MHRRSVRLFSLVSLLVAAVLTSTGLLVLGASSARAATTVQIELIALECYETEDNTGADVAQLRVSGSQVWYHSMNNGQTEPVNVTRQFTGSIKIDLYDLDAGTWYDPHDRLGTVYVYDADLNQGDRVATFTNYGSHYRLVYRVKPL